MNTLLIAATILTAGTYHHFEVETDSKTYFAAALVVPGTASDERDYWEWYSFIVSGPDGGFHSNLRIAIEDGTAAYSLVRESLSRTLHAEATTLVALPDRYAPYFGPILPEGLTFVGQWTGALEGAITATVISPMVGDTNYDDAVDFRDFVTLANNFGEQGLWHNGEFDGNGIVDFPDFTALSNNFGSSTATVPEPTTWLLAMWFVVSLRFLSKRVLR